MELEASCEQLWSRLTPEGRRLLLLRLWRYDRIRSRTGRLFFLSADLDDGLRKCEFTPETTHLIRTDSPVLDHASLLFAVTVSSLCFFNLLLH